MIGSLPLIVTDKQGIERVLLIHNVRLAPTFNDTLISVDQLWTEAKVDVVFRDVRVLRAADGLEDGRPSSRCISASIWRPARRCSIR